ncbi:lysine-specific demethylase 6A-like isoform X2 [Cataglyphis hispanica]|nr:lysine-specific demethylase 6A-like isoform X2 [Cataglyphis hispanica]
MCKNEKLTNVPQSSLLNVCQQTPLNPLSPQTGVKPFVNCFCVTSKNEAFDSSMREFCMNFPIVMIQDLVTVLDLNLSLFSTKTIVETSPKEPIEIRIQMLQLNEENWDRNRSKMVWKYYNYRIYRPIVEYAIYQTKKLQESIEKEKEKENAQNKEIIFSYFLDLKKFKNKDTITKDTGKFENEIFFGTNVDLSNREIWKQQLKELKKLPPLFQVESNENMLNHVGHNILGVNTVQLYMKIPGCRTPGHQENNNFCSVNINIGPGDCEWFAVPYEYWSAVSSLCTRNGVNYLGSWWPPNLDELYKENIPVYRFLQKPGDLVWVNVGCVHWVQATGFCNNIAWNVGPFTAKQYQGAIERYEWNKLDKFQSLIPMVHLSWNLAHNNNISDVQLYQMIKNCLLLTMRQHYLTLEFVRNKDIFVAFLLQKESDLDMVCEKCEKKLGKVITPDPWKTGARNTVESGGRQVGENKALSAGKARFNPYTTKFEICRICRQKVHQVGSHYCQSCAYKKAICAMCGKKLMNTKNYKQSAT